MTEDALEPRAEDTAVAGLERPPPAAPPPPAQPEPARTPGPQPAGRGYDAFVSYSHAADGQLAPALQAGLQSLGKPWYRRRALRVFRDKTSLSASPELWPSIERALAASRFFVLLASPEAASSRWVDQEVRWWLEHRSPATMLIGLTGGELAWDGPRGAFDPARTTALPPAARAWPGVEPLWIDLRWARQARHVSQRDPRFRDAVADLAAPARGLPKDELIGEDIRQHRRALRLARGAVAGLLALAVTASASTVVAVQRAEEARRRERTATSGQVAAVSELLRPVDPRKSKLLAASAWRIAGTERARSTLLSTQAQPFAGALSGHTETVYRVAFSPDGRTLASASEDHTARLWDLTTRHQIGQPFTAQGSIQQAVFSPDGHTLAAGSSDGKVRWWDVATGRQIGQPLNADAKSVLDIALSPDGRTLATAGSSLQLWDVVTRRPIGLPLTRDPLGSFSVTFSPDGRTLATASTDAKIRLWDVSTRHQIGQPLSGSAAAILDLAFSPDGHTLATASTAETTVRLWDPATGHQIKPISGHTDVVYGVAFSPDGSVLATASKDQTVRLWSVATHRQIGESFTGHTGTVWDVEFSPDGRTLASSSDDHTVMLWTPFIGPSGYGDPTAADFARNGRSLAVGYTDGTVRLWDLSANRQIGQPLKGQGEVDHVAFSPNGHTLAAAYSGKGIRLWDLIDDNHRISNPLAGGPDTSIDLQFSPDGRTLAVVTGDWSRLWDVASRRPIGKPMRKRDPNVYMWSASFDPSGRTLAVGELDGAVRLWDVATQQPVGQSLTGHTNTVDRLAFSPDGRVLATGSWDRSARLWDVTSHHQIGQPLLGHTDRVNSVAFSPDGRLLATAGWDGTVRLWDVRGHSEVATLGGQSASIGRVAFGPAGDLLGLTTNGGVATWDTDPDVVRERLCGTLHSELSRSEWAQQIGGQAYRPACRD